MASFNIILLAIFSILVRHAASKVCPANQEMSCESLRSSSGYTYPLPPGISCATSCEEGWYFQNGTFIVDPTLNASGRRLPIVVDVTPQNLTISVCVNLKWQLDDCECSCAINYTVTDSKHSVAHDPHSRNNASEDEHDGNHDGNAGLPAWVIALITITVVGAFVLVIIGIWKKCCKSKDVL